MRFEEMTDKELEELEKELNGISEKEIKEQMEFEKIEFARTVCANCNKQDKCNTKKTINDCMRRRMIR